MPGLISLYRPYFDWAELLAVLRPGPGRSPFEAAVASYVGGRYGLAFAYGRCGALAVFKALGLGGAEVIMPAYTCTVMADPIIISGNRPVFVDIDLADYNMDVQAIKRALTPRTRAIIATHMYGNPTDVNTIRELTGDDRVLIIEDAALALRPPSASNAGIGGDVALYSFGPGKQLYTVSGGVLVTNSAELYEKIKVYRDREMNRLPAWVSARRRLQVLTAYMALSATLEARLLRVKNVGAVRQTRAALGMLQAAMPTDYDTAYADFQGRMGLAQLGKLATVLEWRRAIAGFYERELQGLPGLTLAPQVPGATFTYYSVRVERRDERCFRQRAWERGIEVGHNFSYTLPALEAYRAYADGPYPRAEQLAREVVNLPNFPGLRPSEMQRVVATTRDILQE